MDAHYTELVRAEIQTSRKFYWMNCYCANINVVYDETPEFIRLANKKCSSVEKVLGDHNNKNHKRKQKRIFIFTDHT
jgi:hypothetical protein